MDKWNKMKEELDLLNKKSFKGKNSIESANVLSEIDSTNKREDMFNVIKELYKFSKKALNLAKPSDSANRQDVSNIEEVIKKLEEAVKSGKLTQEQADARLGDFQKFKGLTR